MSISERTKERQAEAVRLRARGLSYREIGEQLGVGKGQARRLANPKMYAEHLRNRAEAKRDSRKPCRDCGKPKAYDRPENELCAACQHDAEYGERNERIFEAWNRGEKAPAIAAREGISETNVVSLVSKHRLRNGRPLVLHRRRSRELWPDIEELWNEGLSGSEIAERLGTNAPNVYQMVAMMREVGGYDVPWRIA